MPVQDNRTQPSSIGEFAGRIVILGSGRRVFTRVRRETGRKERVQVLTMKVERATSAPSYACQTARFGAKR